jgi:ABC-2 type transport system ATP-binding protein
MIEVKSLKKSYGRVKAVNNLSFEVRPGEIVAFVGPNGAGKSTTLKVLSTYLQPDSGLVTVNGIDVMRDPFAVRMMIGYQPETSIMYEGMRVDKFLKFIGRAHWLRGAKLKENFDWVVSKCRLEDVLHKRIGQCSKGYHRRITMAMALIHNPDILLLDEPTHGLDPLQVITLREFIMSLKAGKAILFSSHIIQEVEAICDRVLIINDGVLLSDGTPNETAIRIGRPPVAELEAEAPADDLREALENLKYGALKDFRQTAPSGVHAEIQLSTDGLKNEIEQLAAERNWTINSYTERRIELERIFADLVKKSEMGSESS